MLKLDKPKSFCPYHKNHRRIKMIITVLILIILCLSLMPKIKTFISHHHCPHCHSWGKLKFHRFDSEYVVTGHDQNGLFSGLFKSLRIFGLFGGINCSRDQPFLRLFGTAHYFCPKCHREVMIEEHRDKR